MISRSERPPQSAGNGVVGPLARPLRSRPRRLQPAHAVPVAGRAGAQAPPIGRVYGRPDRRKGAGGRRDPPRVILQGARQAQAALPSPLLSVQMDAYGGFVVAFEDAFEELSRTDGAFMPSRPAAPEPSVDSVELLCRAGPPLGPRRILEPPRRSANCGKGRSCHCPPRVFLQLRAAAHINYEQPRASLVYRGANESANALEAAYTSPQRQRY